MAYRPVNINVLDLKPSTAIGVSIPFSNQSAFESVYTTAEQIKFNIINYLLTDRRERLYNPGFGAGLNAELFEQMTPEKAQTLEARLRSELSNYFPSINVTTMAVTPNYDRNYITLLIEYELVNSGTLDQISLNFNSNGI